MADDPPECLPASFPVKAPTGDNASGSTGRWLTGLTVLVLGWVTFAVFAPLLTAQFINYDDPDFVTQNPQVLAGLQGPGLEWAFRSLSPYWQPLTWISYMTDVQVHGQGARGFHLTNLLHHILNTVVLFLALRRMTGAHWRSAFVAALFSLHPLHVETVAWIAERKGILSSSFWMLALWAYVRYSERPVWTRFAPVAACYVLGLMAKSMVITLPAVLMLLDYWPLGRLRLGQAQTSTRFPAQSWPRLVGEKALLIPFAMASTVLTFVAQQGSSSVWSAERFTFWQRVSHSLVSYVAYVRKTFLPIDLAVFYPHPLTHPTLEAALCLAALLGVSALAVHWVRSRPYLAVGWFSFTLGLAPVIGMFQTGDQAMADRYTYLPLIGVFIIAAWGGLELARAWGVPALAQRVAPLAAVGVCGFLTAAQLKHWNNTTALFEHALAVTRDNYVAYAIVAAEHGAAGRTGEAIRLFSRALEIRPDYFEGHSALGDLYASQFRFDLATNQYWRALALSPEYPEAHGGLGAALAQLGNPAEGISHIEQAIKLRPDAISIRLKFAEMLLQVGRSPEATGQFQQILRAQPASLSALFGLGNSLLVQGRSQEALLPFQEILRVQPASVPALSRVAWLMATHASPAVRNGAEAVRLAARSCELTGHTNALCLNALAAAYAENGQFDQAVATAEKALAIANASGKQNLTQIVPKLLDLYRARTPYRE